MKITFINHEALSEQPHPDRLRDSTASAGLPLFPGHQGEGHVSSTSQMDCLAFEIRAVFSSPGHKHCSCPLSGFYEVLVPSG